MTRYQKLIVALLASIQFTVILDFTILSPLGAFLLKMPGMSPSRFGLVVSAYALSAGVSGLVLGGLADRFDRRKFLLFLYSGFIAGTLACALAQSFSSLLLARAVTGFFGGVIGAVILAVTADLFSFAIRGRVIGFVQTAYASSQVLGVPLGLYLSNIWSWHAAFLLIVGMSSVLLVTTALLVRPIVPPSGAGASSKGHLLRTLANPRYAPAFAVMALLSTGSFMLMPFGSAYCVNNLGIPAGALATLYFCTGAAAIGVGPVMGWVSDAVGKDRLFLLGAFCSVVVICVYTHLPPTTLLPVILVFISLAIVVPARVIPAQAIVSGVPGSESRGAFMAICSSLQQVSGALAAAIAGRVVWQEPGGRLHRFDTLGWIVCASIVMTVFLMRPLTVSRRP